MPKRTDIHKVLVIGSGPIVIGQAAEFDYAGTQACLALREEGYEVILCTSNHFGRYRRSDRSESGYAAGTEGRFARMRCRASWNQY